MYISRESLSLKKRALEHFVKENLPTLSIPVINKGETMIKKELICSLPLIIENKRD